MDIIELMTREIEDMQSEAESVKLLVENSVKRQMEKGQDHGRALKSETGGVACKHHDEVKAHSCGQGPSNNNTITNAPMWTEANRPTLIFVQPYHMEDLKHVKYDMGNVSTQITDVIRCIEDIPKMTKMSRILDWIARASDTIPINRCDIIDNIDYDVTAEVKDNDIKMGDEAYFFNIRIEAKKQKQLKRANRQARKAIKNKQPTEVKELLCPIEQKAEIPTQDVESKPKSVEHVETAPSPKVQIRSKIGFRARFVKSVQSMFACFRPKMSTDDQ